MRNQNVIPNSIRSFVLERIDSVGELEVLLLLFANAGKDWTESMVGLELRSSSAAVEKYLNQLREKGLIVVSTDQSEKVYSYRLQVKPNIDSCINQLARYYSGWRVSIINLIYSKPVERLRGLADAFKIKKE